MTPQPSRRRILSLLTLACCLTLALPAIGHAASADALRAAGKAGERFDGYLEARDPSAAADVTTINAERRALYEKRAAEQGVDAAAVGKVYAKQIYAKLASGAWFKQPDGTWVQKP